MKTFTLLSSALMAGVLFASSAAMAAPQQHQRLDVNIAKLDMRIDAGVKSGKLTQGEERQVRQELRALGSSVKAALKDHKVTKRERTNLEGKEAALNKLISKLANNKAVAKKDDRRDDRRDGKHEQRDQHQPAPIPFDKMKQGQPPMPHAQHAK